MTEYMTVSWTEKFNGKWKVASGMGVHGTHKKKKTALNKAKGEAQQVADEHDTAVIIDVHSKSGDYQRTEKVFPSR